MKYMSIGCMPMRRTSSEMYAYEAHAHDVHAHEIHAYEVHAQ
jgi:hypothetical protein